MTRKVKVEWREKNEKGYRKREKWRTMGKSINLVSFEVLVIFFFEVIYLDYMELSDLWQC